MWTNLRFGSSIFRKQSLNPKIVQPIFIYRQITKVSGNGMNTIRATNSKIGYLVWSLPDNCSKNPRVGCVWWIQNKDWSENSAKEWVQSLNCKMHIFLNCLLFVSQNWRPICGFLIMNVSLSTIKHHGLFLNWLFFIT